MNRYYLIKEIHMKEKENNKNFMSASNLPYPPISVQKPNKYYALLLLEDYTGVVSEMTAINQYIYHDFTIYNTNPKIAKVLEHIAIVEMHHLDILAQLIILLGGNPTFYNQGNYWNGSYVYYGNNVLEKLIADLNAEKEAIKNYQLHIKIINDPYIKNILSRIVIDEEIHVQIFNDLISDLRRV